MFMLTKIRLEKGLSKAQLAYKAKIHPTVISRIESGKQECFPGWRKRLAEALGVPEEILFEVVDDENSGRTA
jgi:transcriptional regulator with XRE-family HTH domain